MIVGGRVTVTITKIFPMPSLDISTCKDLEGGILGAFENAQGQIFEGSPPKKWCLKITQTFSKKQQHLLNIQVNSGEWSNKLNVFGGSVNSVLADIRRYHAVPTIPMTTRATSSSWWFQPLWKIFVKMGIFPK